MECSCVISSCCVRLKIDLQLQSRWAHIKGNVSVSALSFELLILSQANLAWWYIIISQSVHWKIGWLYSRFKANVQNFSIYLSRWFLNYTNIWNKTLHSETSSWTGVSVEKIDLLSWRLKLQWGVINIYVRLLKIYSSASKDIVCHVMVEWASKNIQWNCGPRAITMNQA